jgi:CheY-like chemotaxis protein
LLGLLNGILDFSKIEAGKLDIAKVPCHLPSCIHESVSAFAATAKAKGLWLTSDLGKDLPEVVIGDGMRLRQVLMSLVSNALKFTEQGTVRVVTQASSGQDGRIWISFAVKDTGIGVPSSRMDQLFRPFTQVDASITRHHGGTGLGLIISKSLVELMGGEISAESREGEGSTFQFRIPFLPAAKLPEASPEGTGKAESNALRILVAEDNKVNQRILLRLIERLGYSADVAADGAQALEAAQKSDYDLIVMDVQMPEMDGIEATREIRRKIPDLRQPFIVALTAHSTTDDRTACLDAGMNDYLTKPIDLQTLNSTLTELSSLPATDLSVGCRTGAGKALKWRYTRRRPRGLSQ